MTLQQGEFFFETAEEFIDVIFKKDASTAEHSLDVFELVNKFYWELPPDYKNKIDKQELSDAALFHDVGKLIVPNLILKKKSFLTCKEREIIKKHALYGKQILKETVFCDIADIVHYHHERIDGEGYYGITASKIPIESKIIAIADTYSALTSNRVYRQGCTIKKATQILKEVSGTQLDEDFVTIFCNMIEKQQAFNKTKYRRYNTRSAVC